MPKVIYSTVHHMVTLTALASLWMLFHGVEVRIHAPEQEVASLELGKCDLWQAGDNLGCKGRK